MLQTSFGFQAAQRIIEAAKWDEFWGMVVHGGLRAGKSSYAIWLLAMVYGKHYWDDARKQWVVYELDWNAWKKYLVFLPWELTDLLVDTQAQEKKLACVVWDDAGLWANKWKFYEPFCVALGQYANVWGTDVASLILTTPTPKYLLKALMELPEMHYGKIVKTTGNKYQKYARMIKISKGWMSPDFKKSGVRNMYKEEIADIRLPNEVFLEYNKKRRSYSTLALTRLSDLAEQLKKDHFARGLAPAIEKMTEDIRGNV